MEYRLAKAEAMIGVLLEKYGSAYDNAYKKAVEDGSEEDAAAFARLIRNRKLEQTDCRMVQDRPEAAREAWVAYRQALRDIPDQAGFPMNITWPEEPEDQGGVNHV